MSNLVYIKYNAQISEKQFEYSFYFSDEPENVWGKGWDEYNISLIGDPIPEESTYNEIITLRLPYKLALAQDNKCYPMEYAIYCIVALGWIDINILDEYPDEGRMVFHFGDSKKKVAEILKDFNVEFPQH